MVQVLLDHGAQIHARDDYGRRPLEVLLANNQKGNVNQAMLNLFEQAKDGKRAPDNSKYAEPLYVKYLTPVDQIQELTDFLAHYNDMTTLGEAPESPTAKMKRLKREKEEASRPKVAQGQMDEPKEE